MANEVDETIPLLASNNQRAAPANPEVFCHFCDKRELDHHAQHRAAQEHVYNETIYNYNPVIAATQRDWDNGRNRRLIDDMQAERAKPRWRLEWRTIKSHVEELYNAMKWSGGYQRPF